MSGVGRPAAPPKAERSPPSRVTIPTPFKQELVGWSRLPPEPVEAFGVLDGSPPERGAGQHLDRAQTPGAALTGTRAAASFARTVRFTWDIKIMLVSIAAATT